MNTIGIVLDPSEVATGRTELNLHSGAYQVAEAGPDWGDAEVAASLAERRFGSIPVGYRLPNRIVTIPLILRASGGTTFNAAQIALQQKVARFQDEGGWLKRTSRNGTTKLYADVVNASLTFPEQRFADDVVPDAVLTLECLPDFYGDEAAGVGSTASSGDHDSIVFTEAAVPGDYPARSRYLFTDTGSQSRQTVVIASQSRTYDSAATAALTYEAEALTPLDLAAVATKTGAHGGASNNVVQHTTIPPYSWVPILSTKRLSASNLTHKGTYRLFARVYATSDALVRLEYAIGDQAMRQTNAAAAIPGGGSFFLKDLGEVRIPMGATEWIGVVFAQSDDAVYGNTVGVDKIWLAPAESLSIVKARRDVTADIEVGLSGYSGRDDFLQTAGNLGGKTADVGGNWTTAGGSATDFTIDTVGQYAQRTAVSDTTNGTGRFAVLGSAAAAGSVYVEHAFTNDVPAGFTGVLARYTDANNWMAAGIYRDGFGNGSCYIFGLAAGSLTELYAGPSWGIAANTGYSTRFQVAADGAWQLYLGGLIYATGQHPVLSATGALASGKFGIYDSQTSSTGNTRFFNRYAAFAPDVDAACFSGGELTAAYDRAERERAALDNVFAPAYVEGSYPRAPAAGVEARTCRTLILPSSGDLGTLPDADPLAFSIRSYHRPAYLFAPKE